MNTKRLLIVLVLLPAFLLGSCSSAARVGELRTESQSVALGNATSVRLEIDMGAGNLQVTGGADQLLESDFVYNVAKLKPEVRYANGTLIVRQPDANGLPVLEGITDFRKEWTLRLSDQVPMELSIDLGAGAGNLELAGLTLTGLDVSLGAGEYMIDLSGDWDPARFVRRRPWRIDGPLICVLVRAGLDSPLNLYLSDRADLQSRSRSDERPGYIFHDR